MARKRKVQEDPVAEVLPEIPPPPPPQVILEVYGQRRPGDDVVIIGSPEGLLQLRNGLDAFLKRVAADHNAVGRVEQFVNSDGSTFDVRIRVGSSYTDEQDWKVLSPEYPEADPENKSNLPTISP
jgi:hypothetical protein